MKPGTKSSLADLFTRSPFGRKPASNRSARGRRNGRLLATRHEALEQRLAMAIDIFPVFDAPWAVITGDDADNVYMQQVATVSQSLLVADNSSFRNFQTLSNINSLTSLYVTNGSFVSASGVEAVGLDDSVFTRFTLNRGEAVRTTIRGTLSYGGNTWSIDGSNAQPFTLLNGGAVVDPDLVFPVSFSLFNADDSEGGDDEVVVRWNAPPISDPAAGVAGARLSVSYNRAGFQAGDPPDVDQNLQPGPAARAFYQLPVSSSNPGRIVPGTLSGTLNVGGYLLDFRTEELFGDLNLGTDELFFYQNQSTVGTVVAGQFTNSPNIREVRGEIDYNSGRIELFFQNPDDDDRPQSVGAVQVFADYAVFNQDARPNEVELFPGQDFGRGFYVDLLTPGSTLNINSPLLQGGSEEVSLRATNINVNARLQSGSRLTIGESLPDRDAAVVGAQAIAVVSPTGEISAIGVPSGRGGQGYDADSPPSVAVIGGGGSGATAVATVVDGVVVSITVTDPGSGYTSIPTVVVASPAGAAFARATVAAGQVSAVEMVLGGSNYDDDLPPTVRFVGGGGTGAEGHAVVVDGVVTEIVIDDPGVGYKSAPAIVIDPPAPRFEELIAATSESLRFNAAVAANVYDIRVADDEGTPSVPRGQMFVSTTGSLSGTLGGGVGAASLFVEADTSDIFVDGEIFANLQTYILRSAEEDQHLAPFVFSTAPADAGVDTGLIRGGTVAITLANDTDSPEVGAAAASVVRLRTGVNSMRVKAASRIGESINGPFPYELTIRDIDDISFDAVAASSRAILLAAGGNMSFTSAVATYGDLSIDAGGDFTVSAPLSTVRGGIVVSGNSVAVNNSIRVLDRSVDESLDDITIVARSGGIRLNGLASAVNNVRLVQSGNGSITGPFRISAQSLDVEADGLVDIRTDVALLDGIGGGDFAVDEVDDVSVVLRAPGLVTLRAGGVDPGSSNPRTPNVIALSATLLDVTNLDVTAPMGSVHVTSNTSKQLTLGNAAAIGAGKVQSMLAAGDVTIRSTAGPVVVADAPLGGGNAIPVRVATIANLNAVFDRKQPGLYASTLTNAGPLAALAIDGVAMRLNDRVLVKDQANDYENGLYQVTSVGSPSRAWVLTRIREYDTTKELPDNSFVKVGEGTAANQVFTTRYEALFGESPIGVAIVANRPDAVRVRVATSGVLAGTYDMAAGTIMGTGTLPVIDGLALAVGDRVLVRGGVASFDVGLMPNSANGVYEVTNLGGVGGTWVLTRAVDSDTGLPIETGYVATTEGALRASLTGQAFLLSYDSMGFDPMIVEAVGGVTGRPVTDIGTEDVNDMTSFVVASAAGMNDSAGSLGKMLLLRQANDTSASELNPDQKMNFGFATVLPGLAGAPAGVIRLGQELPVISKAFAIDGGRRIALPGVSGTSSVVVDGSRISTTRAGGAAALASEINGVEFVAGSGGVPNDGVNEALPGASLQNLTLGGFGKGAAVKVADVEGILVNRVVLGRNETGDRLANKFGVLVEGAGAGATVLNSTIVGGTSAGIRTESGAAGVTVVGATIGAVDQNNAIGLDLQAGSSRIGVVPIKTVGTGAILIEVEKRAGLREFVLPENVPLASVYVGQPVSGQGIATGSMVAAIDTATRTVLLSEEMTVNETSEVRFGVPARNAVQANLVGAVFGGGSSTMVNSDVFANTYDGVRITGGSHVIGGVAALSTDSNAIYSNGRFGVNILSTGAGNTAIPANQSITKNYFSVMTTGRTVMLNKSGNVGVNTAKAPAVLGYTPDAVTALDSKGNQHGVPKSSTGGGSGGGGGGGGGGPVVPPINSLRPTVVSVTPPSNGSYTTGQTMTVSLTFNQAVYVRGKPQLRVVVGSNTRIFTFAGGSGSATLTFSYRVVAADFDYDGIQMPGKITLPTMATTIKSGKGGVASLTLPSADTSGVFVNA